MTPHDPGAAPAVPPAHRRFGTFPVAAGVFGIVVSIAAAVGAIAFLALVEDDVDASAEVTTDAITAAQDSVDVFRWVVGTGRGVV